MFGSIPPHPHASLWRGAKLSCGYVFVAWCFVVFYINKSRDSSVGITLGYGLDYRRSRVRLPGGAGNFCLHHRVQNGSGAHPASYPVGSRGCFRGGHAAGV
jgi:hypothetical protein